MRQLFWIALSVGALALDNIVAHGVYDTGSFLLVLTSCDRELATIGHRLFG